VTSTGKVIGVEENDEEMNAAMEAARDSFADFRSQVEADQMRPIPVIQSHMVKAYFADDSKPEEGEHLWITDVSFSDDKISGVVASDPLDLPYPSLGDKVTFSLSELSDWLIVEDGKAAGAYTIQLLRRRMDPQELQSHDSSYPFSFEATN